MARFQDMGDSDYLHARTYVASISGTVRVDGDIARKAPIAIGDVCGCCGMRRLIVKRVKGERGYDSLVLRCQEGGIERDLRVVTSTSLDD